ncbi:hypothetical protein [Amphibacillus indicireducens]|uniref:Uncharacterized protein n=1 Tax=Amphibacillus indicireducens TaxID=1076330 RepID=A0ABP7V7S7_9BACI
MKLKIFITFTFLILFSSLLIGCQENKQTINENDHNYLIYLTENIYGEYTIANSFNGRFNLEEKEDYQYVLAIDYSDDTEETFEEELMRIHEKLFAEAKQRIEQN